MESPSVHMISVNVKENYPNLTFEGFLFELDTVKEHWKTKYVLQKINDTTYYTYT